MISEESGVAKFSFLEKALDFTRAGVIVTDASLLDNPIVYANKGFADITGYKMEEIIGHNCRFLQGKETNPATIKDIKRGISNQTSINVQILNYTKDNRPFWNELFIDPMWMNEKLYFVGVQKDITEKVKLGNLINDFHEQITQLSTPIVPIKDGISVLPIIGVLSEQRYDALMEQVSMYISEAKDDYFIVDFSGLLEIDTFVVNCIYNLNNLISLTGTTVIITGINPSLARKMGDLQVTFNNLNTFNTVKSALLFLQGK
ncbi:MULTISPECIES: PAS domain-containing protein [Priestia]|uniref:PAS domain-containing protein n=1 Tax=Priestia TaxID=2800373 RepID=UPI0013FAFFFD|nr:STAS domain-containing protein [Priestia megaterium]MBW0933601.1 PAS domain-containing protein [Priestia megaterium]MED4035784.1 PAS domain-containing protein [Priestia megaterium]NGY69653.1 PAS domain-containing protein [Priestia megaterium]NGY69758.1 PAS domain-containing protein [Priestia megaterium]